MDVPLDLPFDCAYVRVLLPAWFLTSSRLSLPLVLCPVSFFDLKKSNPGLQPGKLMLIHCPRSSLVCVSHLPQTATLPSSSERKCYSQKQTGIKDPWIIILAFPLTCSLLCLCVPQFTHPGIIISTSQGYCEALLLRSLSGRWG